MWGQCIPIRVDKQEKIDVLYWEFICTPMGIISEVNPKWNPSQSFFTPNAKPHSCSRYLSAASITSLQAVKLPLVGSGGVS